MDRLESLSNTLSQLTMYDIKSMYNQAKNVVLNVSETEAKVREATNDEPWGASSTLMQEIAQGTFNFQQFNEIMPCIYGRFMEKEARQWRQIYKALQLLEYLIKHGSERVVDDARSHISTLKMLRSFHYIDEKGKDEGINVRNRAKELVELLSDVEKIRVERRKAKANKSKYIGVGNEGGYDGGGLSFSSGGSRYGGFGSDSLGGGSYNNADYYSGGSSSRAGGGGGFSDSGNGRRQYEEYDAGGDEITSGSGSAYGSGTSVNRSSSARSPPARRSSALPTTVVPAPAPAPAPAPVPNLLDFDDDDNVPIAASVTTGLATNKALPKPVGLDDDDFGGFETAPVQAAPAPAPVAAPVAPAGVKPNLMQMLNAAPLSPTITQTQPAQQQTGGFGGMGGMGMHRAAQSVGGASMQPMQAQGGMFGGANTMRPTSIIGGASPMAPMQASMRANTTSPGQQKPAAGASGGGFDDLWNLSLASSGKAASTGQGQGQGKSMKDLEKEKASAGLWGAQGGAAKPGAGAGFGSFGGAGASGGDDLLL
ncbi:ENTH-domain-containing protein [Macrolepiota fuliginosa MF-IS2]|uniref:ENTH-domain-containing protein n=1 Tax=Macrolepiota fuliginosa MF-IS2 TaxID=1400762 RepID=A0A9P5XKP3_9AGAR|nr:ENTH-domain-containing protein [Macrolepiota fuliginosa MF-IS2]